jgi:hypothetical protein
VASDVFKPQISENMAMTSVLITCVLCSLPLLRLYLDRGGSLFFAGWIYRVDLFGKFSHVGILVVNQAQSLFLDEEHG